MSQNVPFLKPKQRLAIASLLTGSTIEQASEAAGVNRKTLGRWMRDEDFKRALDSAVGDLARAAARRLAGLLEKSVGELESLLNTMAGMKPHERLQVIRTVLTSYSRTVESITLEDRVAGIERLLNDQ